MKIFFYHKFHAWDIHKMNFFCFFFLYSRMFLFILIDYYTNEVFILVYYKVILIFPLTQINTTNWGILNNTYYWDNKIKNFNLSKKIKRNIWHRYLLVLESQFFFFWNSIVNFFKGQIVWILFFFILS